MLQKKKTNPLVEDLPNVSINTSSLDDIVQSSEDPNKDLKIVIIPKSLHEHFECVVGKHVSIDKPWTQVSLKKITDHIESENENSCFWKIRKKLGGITNKNVLVGYKPFSGIDEEFLICTTDNSIRHIEETQTQMEHELEQKVGRSMFRVPGPWESKSSDKDIEEIKPVQTRDKITYKWKLPAGRLQAKAEFEDSNSKSMKNEYVKLEPRTKEVFEISNMLTMDSGVQATREMVHREMQTIPRIKDNKCIQSVAVEEEMFQIQPLTKPDKALDDFLEKHVPNLVDQLHYNELYDLYRDDYKQLKNDNDKLDEEKAKTVKLLPGYQNLASQKRFVSSFTWHPTIPGIFAVSYTIKSNALYKIVSLETSSEDLTKSESVIEEKYGISYSDNDNDHESWNKLPEAKLVDENYKEKIMSLLNKEFVQRMRIIQVTEEEKTTEQYNREAIKELRSNSLIFERAFAYREDDVNENASAEQCATSDGQLTVDMMIAADGDTTADGERVLGEWWSQDDEYPADERAYYDEHATDRLLPSDGDTVRTMDQWTAELCAEENAEDGSRTKGSTASESYGRTAAVASADDDEDKDAVDHHDSDTESFYNIWGGDDEWLYGNRLRNVVRNLHREFNQKYDREAREEKLFRLLKSEAKYAAKKTKIDDMEKERMKLTKDMFEAGDAYQRLKSQQDIKSKKIKKSSLNQNRRYKAIQNDEESTLKRENTPLIDEQNNSVIIWSIDDNIFPKLRLESPEEVYCVEFNPRNGNTVVGGLINGQICIWDISGKLEDVNSNDSSMTKKEKKHHKHLWMHMKWSLDVNFKTRIRPAALSAILESHESMITAIQWIHPMNEITPLGKLVTVQEGHFSEQFFSSSLDGTVKLWDLHSTPLPKSKHQSTVKPRFGHPENLNKYKSPLSIYNNRLKPSYTIIIKEQENAMNNPITAMSFEIPLMRFKYTSNQPMVIGKRQFEYVPSVPNDLNRFLVVGSFMGQIGVVTWDGYDTYQKGQNKDGIKEVCKTIWWGLAHDGPINCIKRNVFYPDIHLVCGGHVVSVWSLNYENGPIWFKRFDDCTNSGLWSTVHPAEFRVSFNNIGVLQFWDFMKYTHRPYYTFDFFLSDGLIASLSAPPPCVRVVERFECADGIHEVLDSGKNELIGFSDSTGAIMMIAVDSPPLGPSEVDAVRQAFQDEVDRRRELDAWNGRYKETYGAAGENNVDDFDYGHAAAAGSEPPPTTTASKAEPAAALTAEQIKRKICDETFKWYFNRRGPQTRLGKMKEAYLEREKQYMVESMMKKKNVSQKHLEEYCNVQAEVKTKYNEAELQKIRIEADETYRDIVNKLLAAERMEEYVFDVDSKRSTESDEIKNTFEKIHQLMVTDLEDEIEKLNDYIKNNPYKVEQENWAQVIELAEREVRDRLNDPTLLKSPALRVMRRKLAKKYIEGGYKIKEWKSRGDQHACDKYKIRETRLNKLKTMYGKSYNPYWDKGLRPQKIKDAVHLRVTEEGDEQSYGSNYFEGESGEGEGCYGEYLSLVESGSMMSNYQEESGREPSVDSDGKSMSTVTENRWEAESYEDEQTSSVKDMYKNQQVYNEYDEDRELETLDEQSQVE